MDTAYLVKLDHEVTTKELVVFGERDEYTRRDWNRKTTGKSYRREWNARDYEKALADLRARFRAMERSKAVAEGRLASDDGQARLL